MLRQYEEKFKIARETGKGRVVRFQEKPAYTEAVNEYDCPHCGAEFGNHPNWGRTNKGGKIVDHNNYETPSDIEFMCNHVGYSWTEDCKCGNCGEMYSQSNGC